MRSIFLLVVAAETLTAACQITTVNNLGSIPAQQAANGLGFNVDQTVAWEYAAAKSLHASWARADCSWSGGSPSSPISVEIQNSNNTSGGYRLPPSCAAFIANSREYGLKPSPNADYGPPWQQEAVLTVTRAQPAGVTTIPVAVLPASLAPACVDTLKRPLCEALGPGERFLNWRVDYSGSLIFGFDPVKNTISLAAATTVPLPAGARIAVNQLLYAPPLISYGEPNLLSDPSVRAYIRYAQFLESKVVTAGGEVELWNEPIWPHSYWASGCQMYDISPVPNCDSAGMSIVVALAAQRPIAGQKYISNWTNKSGFQSIWNNASLHWGNNYWSLYTTAANVRQNIASEAIHPYGNNPEDGMWLASCTAAGNRRANCGIGPNAGSFYKIAIGDGLLSSQGGTSISMTETGTAANGKFGYEAARARFDLRQFLGYQAAGVTPIMFYKLSNAGGYDWFDSTSRQPHQVAKSFGALMGDIVAAGNETSAAPVPTVSSYTGSFPLDTVAMLGNETVLFFAWQQSRVATGNWYQMASPAAAVVSITLPKNMTVRKVEDLVTLNSVAFTIKDRTLTYSVADNPIEILLR